MTLSKKAAYAGTLSSLPGGMLEVHDRLPRGLLVLAAMTIVGMVASLRRNPPPAGRPAARSPRGRPRRHGVTSPS